jgi:hypothetical protein
MMVLKSTIGENTIKRKQKSIQLQDDIEKEFTKFLELCYNPLKNIL